MSTIAIHTTSFVSLYTFLEATSEKQIEKTSRAMLDLDAAFEFHELSSAIGQYTFKRSSAPGRDQIAYDMLKH